MTMRNFPGNGRTQVQQQVQVNLNPDDQRFCQCGHGVFNLGFMLYELKTGVIGQKGLTQIQVFTCEKCGSLAQENTIRSKPIAGEIPVEEKLT